MKRWGFPPPPPQLTGTPAVPQEEEAALKKAKEALSKGKKK